MKIPWEQFRWYAAFHDQGHHPHIHMVCYSADGRSGYLTREGIARIKSDLAKRIFHQELHELYERQTQRRDELTQEAGVVMAELVQQMWEGTLDNPRIEQFMEHLAGKLKNLSGKKQYGYPWTGTVICGQCGSIFKRKKCRESAYWTCRLHDKSPDKCQITQIPESEFERAFLRLYYKLRHHGMPVLSQLLTDLQTAQNRKLLWSLDIVELNKQIADIVRQERLLAELKQQGLVDPDIYITRSNTLAEQLRTAKLEKERFLESEEDQTIRQTQVLLEILETGPEFLEAFDEELFSELVAKIIVENNECLRFRLINGLELTETIERTVR